MRDYQPPLPEPAEGVVYIYGLLHPITRETYYLGRARSPRHRLTGHLSNKRGDMPSARWIRSLRDQGLAPLMVILDVTTDEEWADAERQWIADYRAAGFPLLNVTEGGDTLTIVSRQVLSARAFARHREKRGLTINGVTKAVGEWAKDACVKEITFRARIRNGWDPLDAMTTAPFAFSHRGPELRAQQIATAKAREEQLAAAGYQRNPEAIEKLRQRALDRWHKSHGVTINGVTKTLTQWAKDVGITCGSLQDRLKNGWDPTEAVSTPALEYARVTPERYAKNSAALTGRRVPERSKLWEGLVDPNGVAVPPQRGLTELCEATGLDRMKLALVCRGERPHHRGYTCPDVWERKHPGEPLFRPKPIEVACALCGAPVRRGINAQNKNKSGHYFCCKAHRAQFMPPSLQHAERVAARGEYLTISEWAERLGMGAGALRGRLSRGWDPVKAVTTPAKISEEGRRIIGEKCAAREAAKRAAKRPTPEPPCPSP